MRPSLQITLLDYRFIWLNLSKLERRLSWCPYCSFNHLAEVKNNWNLHSIWIHQWMMNPLCWMLKVLKRNKPNFCERDRKNMRTHYASDILFFRVFVCVCMCSASNSTLTEAYPFMTIKYKKRVFIPHFYFVDFALLLTIFSALDYRKDDEWGKNGIAEKSSKTNNSNLIANLLFFFFFFSSFISEAICDLENEIY